MENQKTINERRNFIKKSSLFAFGTGGLLTMPQPGISQSTLSEEEINVFGPREGFSPQIGTLVSMLNWMRMVILGPVKGMSVEDLDYLIDEKANSIGAMLWHLAATERFYQIHTFEGRKWGEWDKKDVRDWNMASALGEEARKSIKGNDLDFYLQKLSDVRAQTLKELANRDDNWLMEVDQDWFWGPTNNYCKWFHVCEHESNHNGQFKFIKSRLPSMQKGER
ncbi:DinB family protein [Flexithrix dorotheae]|uniref:DinB family protein n=1 Tax=Flexithrix dorotheae TaxID=70993 RepID=UPI000381B83A|nr:DinB family protein [Flexithrix dorotheae]